MRNISKECSVSLLSFALIGGQLLANNVFVANSVDNTVSVFNTSNTPIATIAVGNAPQGIAVTPNGSYTYVSNYSDNSVSVIDTSSMSVVHTIESDLLLGPLGIAFTINGSYAYVANNGTNTVSLIDTKSFQVVENITVGTWPVGIAVTPDGSYAYVANNHDNTVTVINTSTKAAVSTITVDNSPFGVAVTPSNLVCVSNLLAGDLSLFEEGSSSVSGSVAVGSYPRYVASLPNGPYVYVANSGDNSVSVVNTTNNTVTTITSGIGNSPYGVAITPNGSYAYITNNQDNTVSVIDTSRNVVTSTVSVGHAPLGIAVSPELAPLPPTSLIGKQVINTFFLRKQFVNVLVWTASQSAKVVSYNIYRDGVLLATIPSQGPLEYSDTAINRNQAYTYAVVAVDVNGFESKPQSVVIE